MTDFHYDWLMIVCYLGWLVVFNGPPTARSFRDGTPIYCPLRRTWSSVNTTFSPGIEPRVVAWQSITLPLRHASSTSLSKAMKIKLRNHCENGIVGSEPFLRGDSFRLAQRGIFVQFVYREAVFMHGCTLVLPCRIGRRYIVWLVVYKRRCMRLSYNHGTTLSPEVVV